MNVRANLGKPTYLSKKNLFMYDGKVGSRWKIRWNAARIEYYRESRHEHGVPPLRRRQDSRSEAVLAFITQCCLPAEFYWTFPDAPHQQDRLRVVDEDKCQQHCAGSLLRLLNQRKWIASSSSAPIPPIGQDVGSAILLICGLRETFRQTKLGSCVRSCLPYASPSSTVCLSFTFSTSL